MGLEILTHCIEQRWPDYFSWGPKLKILFLVLASELKILKSRKIFIPFFPFWNHFWCLMREKSDNFFENLSIILIFAMFISSDKKVQGPQKNWRAACGPRAAIWPPLTIEHTYDASHNWFNQRILDQWTTTTTTTTTAVATTKTGP